MKAQLDTKERKLTLSESVEFGVLEQILDTIVPGYSTKHNITIDIGTVSDGKTTTTVDLPLDRSYDYYPDYPWLKYEGTSKIKILGDIKSNNNQMQVTFNEGVYTLDINI